MNNDQALLQLLSDGAFHSGDALGAQLGISRAAVWKRLKKLESQGVNLERRKGQGYRLAAQVITLDKQAILLQLGQSLDVRCLDRVESTNDIGLGLAKEGLSRPVAITAEQQLAGRGRLGRQWQSPYGHNVYLTLVWPFEAGTDLKGLSLVVGLALANTLNAMGLNSVGLKWPNDVLVGRHKLAGVLIELSGNLELNPTAIIGIGINGWLGPREREQITQPVTDWLTEMEVPFDRNELVGKLLRELMQLLPVFAQQGFAPFKQAWLDWDVCFNRSVNLVRASQQCAAIAKGVNEDGGLLVETDKGLEVVYGGEVSVKWN